MRFSNQLRQLNASITSAQKAAQYALKHREMAEDLHSCILEQLERVGGVVLCFVFRWPTAGLMYADRDRHTE